MRREIICVVGVIIGLIFVLIGKSYGMDYYGFSGYYGQNTQVIRDHVKSDDSLESYGAVLTLGWIHGDRLHYGIDLDINQLNLDDGELLATSARLFGSYDLIHATNFQLYFGVGAGLGLALNEDNFYLHYENGEEVGGILGVLDGRIGTRYRISPKNFLTIQYRVNHISKPFYNDPGSNTDEIFVGFIHRF